MLVIFGLVLALGLATHVANADFTFGRPQNLGPVVNSAANEAGITLSSDGLELYFSSQRSGGQGDYDIWVCTRQNVDEPWGPPANLGATVNSPYTELYPCLSADGLTLYFSDYYSGTPRPGGVGGGDIWMTTRASRDDPWTTPVNLGAPVNSANLDMSPTVSADGLTLVFTCRDRAGGLGSWDVWMSTRLSVEDPWGQPANLGSGVNSANWDGESGLSADGRALVFGSGRPGIVGAIDLWMTTRKTPADPWDVAVSLGPAVNSVRNDGTGRFFPDMRTLCFCSDRPGGFGGYDLWEAPIIPLVDFNGDRMVDLKDFSRLAQYWGQDESSVDMGPNPWGDGTVDVQDLAVLADYWLKEVLPVGLVGYWKLDETEGTTANDSVGDNDGTLNGDPIWQPTGGRINGALEFDGTDDYVTTPFILDPAAGEFSVFAWVKGDKPGRVIVSQIGGMNWLLTDATEGRLMTELTTAGRFGRPLISQTIVTDGTWHRVGLTWDGRNRILYVDDVEVVKDTQGTLASSTGGLYLGAGKNLEAGTFWTGLIDDVRIYDRAVTP